MFIWNIYIYIIGVHFIVVLYYGAEIIFVIKI